jgi:hypothetical protein
MGRSIAGYWVGGFRQSPRQRRSPRPLLGKRSLILDKHQRVRHLSPNCQGSERTRSWPNERPETEAGSSHRRAKESKRRPRVNAPRARHPLGDAFGKARPSARCERSESSGSRQRSRGPHERRLSLLAKPHASTGFDGLWKKLCRHPHLPWTWTGAALPRAREVPGCVTVWKSTPE